MAEATPLDAHVGEEFSITLATNPSTGYSWQIELPSDRVEMLAREYVRSSRLIGAGGEETVRLRARRVGDATIVCSYRRPWEDRSVEERRFLVRIRP